MKKPVVKTEFAINQLRLMRNSLKHRIDASIKRTRRRNGNILTFTKALFGGIVMLGTV